MAMWRRRRRRAGAGLCCSLFFARHHHAATSRNFLLLHHMAHPPLPASYASIAMIFFRGPMGMPSASKSASDICRSAAMSTCFEVLSRGETGAGGKPQP